MLDNTTSFILILLLFITIFIMNYIYLFYVKTPMNNEINNNANTNKISRFNNEASIFNNDLMNNTMASILAIFGLLKLVDLQKFSNIFSKYNLISKHISSYSYAYPFIEITLAIALFFRYNLTIVYGLIILLMIISLLSVSMSLYQGQNLRCGCLGSFFHLPLSYATLSENIIMLLMSFYQYV
jgi:hypothetical protein